MRRLRISLSRPPSPPSALSAVRVVAAKGGGRQPGWDEKYVLVADEQYQAREGSHIITDEAEWDNDA